MNRLLVLLLFYVSSGFLAAQDFSFIVIFKKGEIQSKVNGQTQKLQIGSRLTTEENILLDKGDYVVLMYLSGIATELYGPGTYPIKEVVKKVPEGPAARLDEFRTFVIDKMNMYDDMVIRNHRKRNNSVAAASRSVGEQKFVHLLLDEGGQNWVYGNEVLLKWVSDDSLDSKFNLSIMDLSAQTIYSKTLEQDWHRIQLDSDGLKDQEYVVVSVSSDNSEVESKDYFLSRISEPERRNRIDADLVYFNEEIAAHYLLRALYFEQKDLDTDALTAYERAVQLSEGMDVYQVLRDKFLYSKIMEISE